MEKKRKAEDKRNRRIERKFADPVVPTASPFDEYDDSDEGDIVAESNDEKPTDSET